MNSSDVLVPNTEMMLNEGVQRKQTSSSLAKSYLGLLEGWVGFEHFR